MSTATTKLGLIKPAKGEKFSRTTWNSTLDAIDTASIEEAKFHHFEASRNNQNDNPVGTLWGPGGIFGLRDAGNSFNDDFVAAATTGTDGIRITKEGVYKVVWAIGNAGSSTADLWHIVCFNGTDAVQANGSVLGRTPLFGIPVGDWYFCKANNFYVGPNGTNIFFKFSAAQASDLLNHRIRITKLQ